MFGSRNAISKPSRSLEDDVCCAMNDNDEHEKDTLCAAWTTKSDSSSKCVPPVMVEVLQHQQDDTYQVFEQMNENIYFVSDCAVKPLSNGVDSAVEASSEAGEAPTMTSKGYVESLHSDTLPLALNVMDSASEAPPILVDDSISPDHCCSTVSKIPSSGKLLFCGRRREMEDTAAIVTSFLALPCGLTGECCCQSEQEKKAPSDLHFFGVYDGHGGSQASTYCMQRLHHLLAEELAKFFGMGDSKGESGDEWNAKWDNAMKAAFLKMDKEVGGVCPNGVHDDDTLDSGCTCCIDAIAPENVGTTAIVAVVGSCQIVVANCGDSRAVLARGSTTIPLSKDHKPELEEETSRIEAAGGRVICWDGYRVGGLLALSRAIGDRYLKRYVISEPEVTCLQRMEEDECLILASDGLWDVISNDFACKVARKSLAALRKKHKPRSSPPGEDPVSSAVAALLVKLAYGRGSKDNISVVVVDLKAR